ncbi:glucans biosynthesis glucosyltransferase MdoH [Roseomonas sp. CECT 9278]|uniref:glucans biosynthesis glucosyltransferase MdoH n=1 Tax=Roseomonas sp. CECT 9278 TaxID=2845823 RepID=UPI001E554FB2|nr:glucans biosynthesis glucosyltransferase MdoH [Roseomonas sp. CECT 9278]CAH0287738.1 Glucans biosynthesis glucosyltransferase H [Roseomonas sp. CECT 9278]
MPVPAESPLLRRALFLTLVLAITAGLVALAWAVLAPGGWTPWEALILACFLGTVPWSALSAANALVGLAILLGARDPPAAVLPALRAASPAPPRRRTAIAICIRNEDMAAVLPPLGRLMDGLPPELFALWVLSDTPAGPAAEAEQAAFHAFAEGRFAPPARGGARPNAQYRRRAANDGFKAGNVMDFLDHHAEGLAYFLCLDADSEMTPAAVLRLVACMEADDRLAIVQQLIHGKPATAAFPRLFQFGMRHGMRAWATGQAWWQGDEGPYWGHNALIRIAPFRDLCRLGPLPDGSRILSHDQVEATRLHAAGWKVRVLPDDTGSAEGNPPTFGDFVTRDLRWAGGNMQYLALLRLPGQTLMARWQLVQAILLFLGAPLWCAILLLAAVNALSGGGAATPTGWLVLLLGATWACHYAAKLAGYAEVLLKPALADRYGGRAAFARGAAAEILFTTLMEPARLMAQTLFLLALPFGMRARWTAQNRADRGVTWGDAARQFWPPTLAGLVLAWLFAAASPLALLLALPVLASLLLAIPFAVVTADPGFSGWLRAHGIAAFPEERDAPAP